MYHGNFFDGSMPVCPVNEVKLRTFLTTNSDALCHAAVLLAERRGARLMNAIQEGLGQPGQLTRRMRYLLLDLRDLLFLESVSGDGWEDAGHFVLLDPEDPKVSDICLLADGLQSVLREAGIDRSASSGIA